MKVLIVCNNAFTRGNGLYTALQALLSNLREEGVEARLMATENEDPSGPQPDYPLKHFRFPIFENLIYSNGFRFARIDHVMIEEAVRWADLIHVQEAFPLESDVVGTAARYGKPCVATYHLFPQNVVAGAVHGGISNPFNGLIEWYWRTFVFDRCSHIHCPTETVRRHLSESGYKARMEVFSNGISIPQVHIRAAVPRKDGPIDILCVGRLAYEKSQNTLLQAMRYSAYSERIRLHFAGKGPMEDSLRRKAEALIEDGVLVYPPEFGFYDREQLKTLIRNAYLYIHCAWVEVEGLSCLEAIREGLVPLIAKGSMTATSQFALDTHSVFPVHDEKALARQIDWWIEHPRERDRMGQEYADSARQYDIQYSTDAMIRMYHKALAG